MQNYILLAGRAAGILGILVCIIAVATRISGSYYLAGMETESLLLGGTSAVVVGCFLLLSGKR